MGAQTVVDVMRDIGDIVRKCCNLGLKSRPRRQFQWHAGIKADDGGRNRAYPGRDRAIVFDEPLQCLPCEIEPIEIGVAVFQFRDQTQRVGVVVEAAKRLRHPVQRGLARMSERGMTKIVGECQSLGQILIHGKHARDRTRNLRHLQRVGHPGAVVVALVFHKNLCLVLQPAERSGMDQPVPVALITGPGGAFRFRIKPPAAVGWTGRK